MLHPLPDSESESELEELEESDDESVAPPDEPPPNVPEDAVALAE